MYKLNDLTANYSLFILRVEAKEAKKFNINETKRKLNTKNTVLFTKKIYQNADLYPSMDMNLTISTICRPRRCTERSGKPGYVLTGYWVKGMPLLRRQQRSLAAGASICGIAVSKGVASDASFAS